MPSHAQFLMKLALTKVNLSDQRNFKSLLALLKEKKHVQYVDLSFTDLTTRQLSELTQRFVDMYMQLRDINLSYNRLNFSRTDMPSFGYSIKAIENLRALMKKAKILNHVNFSGMNIPKSYMTRLCQAIVDCQLLMGVHLNDNGITLQQDYLAELCAILKLQVKDAPKRRASLIEPDYNIADTHSNQYAN